MPDIAVVHLVRARNGIEPFRNFIQSYRKNPSGIGHDLLIAFKGFLGEESLSEYRRLLSDIPHRSFRLWDYGFDIRAYFMVTYKFEYQYFCYLNSFSVLLDASWLAAMYRCISQPGVGLVGATGSWESSYTNNIDVPEPASFFGRLKTRHWMSRLADQFDPFPNHHIRTNGFMIARNTMMKIHKGFIHSKWEAHRFESGKNSLTKQVMRMGLKVLITGKDGTCFAPNDWHRSGTFRCGNQENLLIADNQTNSFTQADAETRRILVAYAWGETAASK